MRAPSAERAIAAAQPLFVALGDPTRLRLVAALCADGPSSLARLAEGAGVTRQGVRKHLRVMEEAALVRASWQGRESIWQLRPARLDEARRCLDVISARWDSSLERLRAMVEE